MKGSYVIDGMLMNGNRLIAYNALQAKEMDEHKWYLSENAGHDIGSKVAEADWVLKHAARFRAIYNKHEKDVYRMCHKICNDKCKAEKPYQCPLSTKKLHEILED